jgi:hypothetical protein
MASNRDDERSVTKPKYLFGWLIVVGIGCLVVSIILDSPGILGTILNSPEQTVHVGSFIAKLFEHFGVAVLIAAVVGLVLESEEYGNYFLGKIANTVVKSDYLAKLSKDELAKLQKDLVQAYYKLENLDAEQGFYKYFRRLYEYIASPYREETRGRVRIEYLPDKRFFKIEEVISYTCRKVGGCIQDELKWVAEEDEIKEIDSFAATVTIPIDVFKSEDFERTYPNLKDRETIFDSKKNPEQLKKYSGHGFTLSLKQFSGIDGLRVNVAITYSSPVDRGLSWTMSNPSKKVSLDMKYPDDLRIHVDRFGVNPDELSESHKTGIYTFEYDSWLLPDSGFAFHFLKNEPGTVDIEANAHNPIAATP